jgi:hypothetical protein
MAEGESGPKSALEIAMERLRKLDAEQGGSQPALSDAQKAAIAEARKVAEARLAEREVMYRSQLAQAADHAAREKAEEEYRRDRARITADRDSRVERIRRDGGP